MRSRIELLGLALALVAGPSVVGLAQIPCAGGFARVEGGVTVVRGCTPVAPVVVGVNPGVGTSTPNTTIPSGVRDMSTGLNALHTGSQNAGGVIYNLPPGFGQ